MVKIHRIKKNASTTLALLEPMLVSNSDIDIVVLRNPIERFWSACKSLHPDITFHEKVNTLYHGQIVPSNAVNVDLEKVIADCISMMQEPEVEPHFMPQSDFVGDKKFDYVIKLNEIDSRLKQLLESNIFSLDQSNKFVPALEFQTFDNYKRMNVSPNERNSDAMSIITSNYLNVLNNFYEKDIALFEDFSSLLK